MMGSRLETYGPWNYGPGQLPSTILVAVYPLCHWPL